MTDPLVIPYNAERLLIFFLLDQPEVTAIGGQRIYGELPAKDKVWPAARVTQLDGAADHPHVLVHETAHLQGEFWGGTKAQALRFAETARAAIVARIVGRHLEGVIQDAACTKPRWLPDADFEPAKPRYVFDIDLRGRPPTADLIS